MLGTPKSSGRMLADPELLSLLDLHSCEVSVQADESERGIDISDYGAQMRYVRSNKNVSICRLIRAVHPE